MWLALGGTQHFRDLCRPPQKPPTVYPAAPTRPRTNGKARKQLQKKVRVIEIDGWAVQSILVFPGTVLKRLGDWRLGRLLWGTLEIGEFWKGMIGDWSNESQCPSWALGNLF